ncbi:MAG: hypothetical protein L0229_03290 [Blastocatellia bacterium]|nr:hypothetical protein [Blastocatellia bacterium]
MKSKASGSVRNHTIKSNTSKSYFARSIFRARVLLVLMFFSLLLPAPRAMVQNREQAAPGDLVTTFGAGGVVMTDFAGGHDSANAVTTNLFGKIIAAGSATVPGQGTDFALACYDENGNLDPTFGVGGRVTVDFFGANDGARGVVVQPDDGKIVLSGFATNGGERQFAIIRFNADGSLDSTFDQDGKVVLDLGSTSEAFKVALQEDLKIVAVGDSRPQTSLDFTIVRLNQDGSLDNSFGDDGVVTINFGNVDRAIDLAIDETNIFVCGFVVTGPTDSDFGIARLNISDGSLNNEFGGDGTVTTDFFGKQDGAQAILLRGPTFDINERHLIVGGIATDETQDFALAAYNYTGVLIDNFFFGVAQSPKTTFDFNGSRDQVFDLIDEPDGGFGAIGWAGDGDRFDLGVAYWDYKPSKRWELSGNYTYDTSSGANNVAFGATLYEDTIITAGTGLNLITGNDDFVLTRHENEKFAEIIKRAPATPVVRGDLITYTFEINNLTDNELSFIVTDVLPVGVTFEESQNPDWDILSEFGNSPIIERQLSVPAGQTVFIGLRVRAGQFGILKNKANLLLPHPDDPVFGYVTPTFLGSSEVESEVTEPSIGGAVIQGKKLFLFGSYPSPSNVNPNPLSVNGLEAKCPTILIDGQEQKTKRDPDNPTTVLIAKKGGKKIAPGQTVTLKVRLCDGTETAGFTFTRPQ